MSGLRVRLGTNSPRVSTRLAIETSSSPSFTNFRTFGTIEAKRGEVVQAEASGFAMFGEGTTYIRLRCIDEIPDGSTYIAYDSLEIEGQKAVAYWDFTSQPSWTLEVLPQAQAAYASSLLSTNAQRDNDPVNFTNGVSSQGIFGANDPGYILRNVGVFDRQRYLVAMVDAKTAWSLSGVQVRLISNAPMETLHIAIETSSNPSFTDFRTFGVLEIKSGKNALLTANGLANFDEGKTYIRLRSMDVIPDGSKFIAFDDLLLLGGEQTTGLIHRWNFTKGPEDLISGADAVLLNSAQVTNQILALDGVDDYGILPIEGSFGQLSSFTVESWMKYQGEGNQVGARLLDFGSSSESPFALVMDAAPAGSASNQFLPRIVYGEGSTSLAGSQPVNKGALTHIAVTFDGRSHQLKLFINGEVASTRNNVMFSPVNFGSRVTAWLGRAHQSGIPYFKGEVLDLRIYDGALSDGVLKRLHAAGSGLVSPRRPFHTLDKLPESCGGLGRIGCDICIKWNWLGRIFESLGTCQWSKLTCSHGFEMNPITNSCQFPSPLLCNGMDTNCGKKYDEVSYGTTHNSVTGYRRLMTGNVDAVVAPDSTLKNQDQDIPEQLRHGIRGLMIDIRKILICNEEDPPACGFSGEPAMVHGDNLVYAYYGPFKKSLNDINAFLDSHRYEVVTVIIENINVPVEEVWSVFESSDIKKYLHIQQQGKAWPTLKSMIDDNKRLVVFMNSRTDTQNFPALHNEFDFAWENPWDVRKVEDLAQNCSVDRGSRGSSIFIMNNFVTPRSSIGIPVINKDTALKANSYLLLEHINKCLSELKRPNFVAVDYYDYSAALYAVEELNKGVTKIKF